MPFQEKSSNKPESDHHGKSSDQSHDRRFPGTSIDTMMLIKKEVKERRMRVRKAEKVEKVMHLVNLLGT